MYLPPASHKKGTRQGGLGKSKAAEKCAGGSGPHQGMELWPCVGERPWEEGERRLGEGERPLGEEEGPGGRGETLGGGGGPWEEGEGPRRRGGLWEGGGHWSSPRLW